MTYTTILIATLLFFLIPIASATLARQVHFMLGLQGDTLNLQSIFGRVGFWLLMESKGKALNMFKDAVTCIFCLTHHIAIIETAIAYSWLFNWYGLFSLLIVPAVALMFQNYLQKTVYSQFYSNESVEEEDTSKEDNDRSN